MLPKLFGYTSTGKVKEWSVSTKGSDVIVKHGQVGGKIQVKCTTSKGKNLGKANETTPQEQAVKDALSKWKKQKDKNYHEDLANAELLENPMLAHDYRKQGHRINYPCDVQPKLDGVRCLVKYNYDTEEITLKSRGNKTYPMIPKLESDLRVIFKDHFDTEVMLDGELYIHGESLQSIVSVVKKHEDDEGILKDLLSKVKFHLFDIVFLDMPERQWKDRVGELSFLESIYSFPRIEYVQSRECHNITDLKKWHGKYLAMGYEGIMLRNHKGAYTFNNRSSDLQKYKEFLDEEFECCGVKLDKDGFGVLTLENFRWEEGMLEKYKTFDASWKGTHEERKDIAMNTEKWIGKKITIQYQALTDDKVPQFPISVAVRDYE